MRRAVVWCLLSFALVMPGVQGGPVGEADQGIQAGPAGGPLVFDDPGRDVQMDGEPYTGPYAETVDIVGASLTEDDGLVFRLELAELTTYAVPPLDQDFITQWALTFEREDGAAWSMRASYATLVYELAPLGYWRFQIHDQESDTWQDADGRVDGDAIEWRASPVLFGLASDEDLANWHASAWWSSFDGDQFADQAWTDAIYRIGHGVASAEEPVPQPPGPVCSRREATVTLADERGDTHMGGDPYTGPGSPSTDLVHACVADDGSDLLFELGMAELGQIRENLEDSGFVAQYALSFHVDGRPWATRAMFGGDRYTGASDGAWRFNLHDEQEDAWPEAVGAAEADVLTWRIPKADLGVGPDARLTDWRASSWNSYDEREQIGDWAQSGAVFVPSDAAGEASAASEDANGEASEGAAALPWATEGRRQGEAPGSAQAPPAALAVVVLAILALARRRT